VRLWGSVGFIGANFATAAAVGAFTSRAVLAMMILAAVAAGGFALALPQVAASGRREERFGLRFALRDAGLRRALISGNLVLAGHGAFYAFGSLFWQSQGFAEGVIGGLWAFAVVIEIALFWAARFLPEWGARRFILAGCFGAIARWLLFPFAVWPVAAFALQMLHATTFAMTHLGVMMAIGAIATPGHTAGLQSAHQVIGGLMLASATALAGLLFRLSPVAAFWAMAAMAVLGLVLARGLPRGLQPQSAGAGGWTSAPE